MKFTYDKPTGVWTSKCGNYKIWVQARPRDDKPHWAAQYKEEHPWLTSTADGRKNAVRVCMIHESMEKKKSDGR